MRINDEPLEKFYPICCLCGNPIIGRGYQEDGNDGDYYCIDCMKEIDGEQIARERREAAFDDVREGFYA